MGLSIQIMPRSRERSRKNGKNPNNLSQNRESFLSKTIKTLVKWMIIIYLLYRLGPYILNFILIKLFG